MTTQVIENGRCTADCNENSDGSDFMEVEREYSTEYPDDGVDADEAESREPDDAVIERTVKCRGCGAHSIVRHSDEGTTIEGPIRAPWSDDDSEEADENE